MDIGVEDLVGVCFYPTHPLKKSQARVSRWMCGGDYFSKMFI